MVEKLKTRGWVMAIRILSLIILKLDEVTIQKNNSIFNISTTLLGYIFPLKRIRDREKFYENLQIVEQDRYRF